MQLVRSHEAEHSKMKTKFSCEMRWRGISMACKKEAVDGVYEEKGGNHLMRRSEKKQYEKRRG